MISDLPRDIEEEVLSKLPMTSLRGARSTCKRWNNTLSKNPSFTKKYKGEAEKRKEELQVVMMLEYNVYLMSVNLHSPSPSIEPVGQLHDGVDMTKIFHCDGLLLCVTKDRKSLVVWNPFSGQTRWIQARDYYHQRDRYALGYENDTTEYSRRNHKVLRFVTGYDAILRRRVCEFEIFSLNSNSWNVVDVVKPDWFIWYHYRGLSLNGNTYWFADDNHEETTERLFLLCFDFTTESFGPRLPLPFHGRYTDTVSLSSVREEQLAVLFQDCYAPEDPLEIWISSKVGPGEVSWNKVFLAVDMKTLTGFHFMRSAGSFFVDEEKKVVVVLDVTRDYSCLTRRNMAYIIGENGYFETVDLGDFANGDCWPLVCSYVPSSVEI